MAGGKDVFTEARPRTESPSIAVGELHRILADRCRRVVLTDLATHFHPVPLYDLTHRVATVLVDEQPTDRTYRDVKTALTTEHLPQMEAAGLVQSTPTRVQLTSTGLHVERLRRGFADALMNSNEYL